MSQENLLRRPVIHSLSTWQQREEVQWCRSIRRFLLVVMIISCSYRLLDQFFFYPKTCIGILLAAAVLLVYSLYLVKSGNVKGVAEKRRMIVVLSLIQVYILCLAIFIYPDCKEVWAMKSSIVFCVYEIPRFHDKRVLILLLGRQFFMWQLPSLLEGSGVHSLTFYVIMLVVAVVVLLIAVNELEGRAREYYNFCESIDEQDTKINNLLQAIPEGLAVVTTGLDLPSANLRMQEILCAEKHLMQRLAHLHCLKNIESDEMLSESLGDQISTFLGNSAKEIELFGVVKLGETFYEWKGTKCFWGRDMACILTASDASLWVTSQRNLQQESSSKSAMLRFVSHELRTPANAILNLTSSVLSAENLTPEQKKELSIVETSTYFLLSVVNDLLDFTRITAEKFTLVKQTFDFRKEMREMVSLIRLQCMYKGLFLRLKIDNLIPEVIYSDPTRIKQVVLNLLGNALKFTLHGGIRVVCMLAGRSMLKISVKDTGIGITSDKIEGLCRTFDTVESTQRINPQGCGLGLCISNLLARSLGSRPIDISSRPGFGSEFSFYVQIYQHEELEQLGAQDTTTDVLDEREREEDIPSSLFVGGYLFKPHLIPSVLVVDDSDFNRFVLVKMLDSMNVCTDEATTGLQALAQIRSQARRGHQYSLILMDIEMPEMDGVTATQEIRALEIAKEVQTHVKIVACSAHRGREEAERLIAIGMDGYLEKPVCKARLYDLVASAGIRANTL